MKKARLLLSQNIINRAISSGRIVSSSSSVAATHLLPNHVRIVEVGPRDGLQNEPHYLSADVKVQLM